MKLKINNQVLNIKIPLTLEEKMIGLSNEHNINFGMYFKNCNAIQTYSMQEAIDILVLDNYQQIIFIFNDFQPNQILEIKRNINNTNILELPKGLGKYFQVGNTIKFIK